MPDKQEEIRTKAIKDMTIDDYIEIVEWLMNNIDYSPFGMCHTTHALWKITQILIYFLWFKCMHE